MKRSGFSAASSVLAAIAASACCIGPALLAVVGAGTIGIFGTLESYRPYFIGITVLLVGLAFYLTYRRREVKCEDGSCKTVTAGKWDKASVWFAAIVSAVIIVVPYVDGTANARAVSSKSPATAGASVEDSCCIIQKKPEFEKKKPYGSQAQGDIDPENER